MQQSQKMEAIGTLAGGIAHDFNNILAAIFGYAYLLQQDVDGNQAAEENIEEILQGRRPSQGPGAADFDLQPAASVNRNPRSSSSIPS